MNGRGEEILKQLLRDRTPEERERLSRAWQRFAEGDPDSLPALYALSDRFSLEAHALLLDEVRRIHGSIEGMAREIGEGASATVARTEAAAKAAGDRLDDFAKWMVDFHKLAAELTNAEKVAMHSMSNSVAQVTAELRRADEEHRNGLKWRLVAGVAFLAGMVTLGAGVLGFWIGAEGKVRQERQQMDELLSAWETGDDEAYRQLMERIRNHRRDRPPETK